MARYRIRRPGTTITPQSGRTGAVSSTIASILARTLNVRDFGADPTGVQDSTAAFRNAMYAASQRTINALARSGVYIPYGTYRISGPIPVPTGVNVEGERGSYIRYYGPQTTPLWICEGGRTVFNKLTMFGSDETAATAPSVFIQWYAENIETIDPRFGTGTYGFWGYSGHARISDCVFWRPNKIAVKIEHGAPASLNWRATQTSIEISHSDFSGRRFYQGSSDGVVIDGGRFEWYPEAADDYCFTSAGNLFTINAFGVSIEGATPNIGQTWYAGNGIFQVDHTRFGEYRRPFFSIRKEATIPDLPGTGEGTEIRLTRSMVSVATDLVHCYDDVPNRIICKDNLMTPDGGFSECGIWIKDDGSHTLLNATKTRQAKNSMFIDIDSWGTDSSDFVIRESSSPEDLPSSTANVTSVFRQFNKVPDRYHASTPADAAVNYFFGGVYDINGTSLATQVGINSGAPGLSTAVGHDTSIPGWPVSTLRYLSGTGEAYCGVLTGVAWPPAAWAALPAGDYCWAIWVKANWATDIELSVTDYPGGTTAGSGRATGVDAGTWRQVHCSFYYDGTTSRRFGAKIARWCKVGQDVSFAFPSITKGLTPPRKLAPPTETVNTVEGYIERVVYGETAPPAAGGPYKRGDRWVNVRPSAGQPKMAFCVADGSPGTWETIT